MPKFLTTWSTLVKIKRFFIRRNFIGFTSCRMQDRFQHLSEAVFISSSDPCRDLSKDINWSLYFSSQSLQLSYPYFWVSGLFYYFRTLRIFNWYWYHNLHFQVTHGYLMWGRRWLKMKLIEREEKKLEKKEGLEGKENLIEDRIPDGLTKEVLN